MTPTNLHLLATTIWAILKWVALFPLCLAINFIAYFGASILAFFHVDRGGRCDNDNAYRVEPRLPVWLNWFQTPDNSLLGDGAWQRMEPNHWAWRSKLDNWPRLQAYLGRFGWLRRNVAQGFDRTVLAANVEGFTSDQIKVLGDSTIHDLEGGKAGYCLVFISTYWGLVWIHKLWGTRCLYWAFGWNLKTYAEQPSRTSVQPIAQYVASPRFSHLYP